MTVESLFGFHRKRVRHSMELCLLWRTGTQLHFHARETPRCRSDRPRRGPWAPARLPRSRRTARAWRAVPPAEDVLFFFSRSPRSGSFNSFEGTQLPPLLQRRAHAREFLLEHARQPHQECFDLVGRYLLERKTGPF